MRTAQTKYECDICKTVEVTTAHVSTGWKAVLVEHEPAVDICPECWARLKTEWNKVVVEKAIENREKR